MSEYIEIEHEIDEDDPAVIHFYTNLPLSASGIAETYASYDALLEGSAVAQTLAAIQGIRHVRIDGSDMTITRELDAPEHAIIADVSAALKDFFL